LCIAEHAKCVSKVYQVTQYFCRACGGEETELFKKFRESSIPIGLSLEIAQNLVFQDEEDKEAFIEHFWALSAFATRHD